MKKIIRFLLFGLIPMMLMMACPNGITEIPEEEPEVTLTSEELQEEGIEAYVDEDYVAALDYFDQAVTADPDNAEAAIWWSALYMSNISKDTAITTLATNLGFKNFTGTITIDNETDMSTFCDINEAYTVLFPLEDGSTSFPAFMFTLLDNLQTAYPDGVNTVLETLVTSLSTNLDTIVARLSDIPDDAVINLSEMQETALQMVPVDTTGDTTGEINDFEDLLIGKAEIMLGVSSLELLLSVSNTALSLSLDYSLANMWEAFGPDNITTDVDGAFESYTQDLSVLTYPLQDGFFQAKDDAQTYLDTAKDYMIDCLTDFSDSLTTIISDRTGHVLCSTSSIEQIADYWDEYTDIASEVIFLADEIKDSIENDTTFYIPVDYYYNSFLYYEAMLDESEEVPAKPTKPSNWPTAVNFPDAFFSEMNMEDVVVGVNFAKLYDHVMLDVTELVEFNTDLEPVWYSRAIDSEDSLVVATSMDVTEYETPTKEYFIKVKDLSFEGFIDLGTDTDDQTEISNMANNFLGGMGFFIFENNIPVVYLKAAGDNLIFPFLTLVEAKTTFTYEETEYTTTDSFWENFKLIALELVEMLIPGPLLPEPLPVDDIIE